MVYRVYVEKKKELANEAASLASEIRGQLQIPGVEEVRILNRYDVENLDRNAFEYSVANVFSEPQLDIVTYEPDWDGYTVFAVEPLPGQFDQRADSAAQCIQILTQGERPTVKAAKIYLLKGTVSDADLRVIRNHVINPVESCEASLDLPETLTAVYEIPTSVSVLDGFRDLDEEGMAAFLEEYGLAMDLGDVTFCREYFRKEGRDPTITEIRMIDTYWSDHCRHTTFNTILDDIRFEDLEIEAAYRSYLDARKDLGRIKPVCLMDMGTLAVKCLRKAGRLDRLDESEEINACTVKTTVTVDGEEQEWLLLFKNETHNHPTEIEPFGGAATCIGGAIRDPLSGRSYVYGAMRVTGAADPTVPVSETIPGKLPQRTIVTKAASGYSSYGNQIGLATGQVTELYHPGYAAKRMEVGAVIAAAPAACVRRERPSPGDVVILLGGRTGRDGCGGATGSSKSHTVESLVTCGAEVQKGNAPEERKLQRLFRNPEASLLIKRCNDFGAGGVSVAIGELADGLTIDLNAVPKKYDGLDGTELAISESQERMAVVVAASDAARFMELAAGENLEATLVATVTEEPRLTMTWNGVTIVDISREFLDSNGAEKHMSALVKAPVSFAKPIPESFPEGMTSLVSDLNVCSQRGLSETFDSTIGAGTVVMPFGGSRQLTPIQAMIHKISVEKGHTDTCSVMSFGFNPWISEKSPYHGAYLAVVESAARLVAAGAEFSEVYLSFQEYFGKLRREPGRWGMPVSALLGAFRAQMDLGIAAIGGKDSMSGTFEDLDVPPTLISFAVTTAQAGRIVTPEFKGAGHPVRLLCPSYTASGLPEAESLLQVFRTVEKLAAEGRILAAWTPGYGGAAEAVYKMGLGNGVGFAFADGTDLETVFGYRYGSFLLELEQDEDIGIPLGVTTDLGTITMGGQCVNLAELDTRYENRLEGVYHAVTDGRTDALPVMDSPAPAVLTHSSFTAARPRVLIPVFPGTNCEYDTAKAFADAGAEPEIFIVRNLTADAIRASAERFAQRIDDAQIIFIPGGFSGGDEPDGSGKFITAFFRSPGIRDAVHRLLRQRDGLMGGICNGFQALIKLGLVPYGEIRDADPDAPTLTFNTIGRHQSRLVRTRVCSSRSPWLSNTKPGEIYTVPISHGEGRFLASEEQILQLAANGQIATQYVDERGVPTTDIRCNPNGSAFAVEGILSPDGRVLGKMGHSERIGSNLYRNVPGRYDMGLFASAVAYFI